MRIVIALVFVVFFLQLPIEAKREQTTTTMMKIGEEVFTVEAGETFVKAQEFLNNKQFDQASVLFEKFLVSYPESLVGHYKYGYSLLQQGKDSEASEQAKLCTKLNPGFFGGWALLGESSMNLKLEAQAEQAYKKALAIESTGENADLIRENLAELAATRSAAVAVASQNDQVTAQNRDIVKLNHALSLCDEANELLKKKQFEQGLQVCRAALKELPASPQIKENFVVYLNNYAADCVQNQNLKQAEELMKEALAVQKTGGVTPQSQKTTLKNYTAILKFLEREDDAKQIEAQMNALGPS